MDIIGNLVQKLRVVMDRSKDSLLSEDDVYKHDRLDLAELEERYDNLSISEHDRMVINDYIACINTIQARVADVSYLAGMADTMNFLTSQGLVKWYE